MPDQDNVPRALRGLLSVTSHEFNCKSLPGQHWHVRRFTLDEALSEPYRLSVELLIEESELDVKALLGSPCDLRIERDTDLRIVHGIVERIVELGAVAERLAFQVDLVPAFALRAQSVDTRFFQEMSVPEIVEAVLTQPLEGVGRSLRMDLEAGDFEKREYCVQYRESDFEFVSRLLQEEGIVYYFEHPADADGEVLVLLDDTASCPELQLGEGGDQVLYIDRAVGTARMQSIDSLTPTHSLRTTAIVQRDFDWKHPSESPYEHQRRAKEAPGGERETYDHNDRRLFSDDGAKRARRKLEQRSLQSRVLRGSGDVIEFAPGLAFALVGHPQHALDNEYLLVRVRHRGDAPEEDMFASDSSVRAPRYTNEFECIERDVPWRPEPMFAKRRAHGLQTAIVTGPESEEIHTDAHGRIKVRFHWDRVSPFDDTSSCWIRVAQRWSGPGWGAMILPRVGMEVIVEFVDGDPDRPIVTGCVYNGDNHPPYPLPDEKTKSTLKSDSSPGGGGFNELRFEDAKGREEIFLHAQKDLNEVILNDMSTSVGHDQTLSVKNDRTKTVTGFETQTVHKDRNTTIDGSENLHIKGSLNMTVDGGSHKGRGPDPAALGSGVTVTGEYNIIATKKLTITVGASKLIMDTSHISLETSAEMKLTVGGSSIKLVPAQIDVASDTIAANAKASSLKLDAAAELKSGATVKIHGDGVVTVEGSTIKLNS
jgi:type VI secretion system secreted protein VgrG